MKKITVGVASLWMFFNTAAAHDCTATEQCRQVVNQIELDGEMVLKKPLAPISSTPYQDLQSQIDFINNQLVFAATVTVRVDVEDGPLYDPATDEVWMPMWFGDSIASTFAGGNDTLDATEQQQIVNDVVLHTLVHEAGHALFAQVDIPRLSREEDAVDALASIVLLEFHERGDEVVLNAAEMFGLESDSVEWFEAADFWDEHSLDIQRYYTSICHVYGSDSEGNEELINEEYGLSEERAEACIEEYELLRDGWLRVLEPYLR